MGLPAEDMHADVGMWRAYPAQLHLGGARKRSSRRPVMAIVGAFDVHRKQITFDYVDTETGQVRRGRVQSPTSLLPHRPQRAGLGRLLWPRHGLLGHLNAKNSRQNGHETPLRWPKKRWRGQGAAGVAKAPLAWPKKPRVGAGTTRGGWSHRQPIAALNVAALGSWCLPAEEWRAGAAIRPPPIRSIRDCR